VTLREREDLKKQESGKFLFEWEGQRLDSSNVKAKKPTSQNNKNTEQQKFKIEWDGESK
jgi:flagellar hook assembly protein FlgD